MQKPSSIAKWITVLGVACLVAGCNLSGAGSTTAAGSTPGGTAASAATDTPALAEITETLAPSFTPTVVHLTMPSAPAGTTRFVTDPSPKTISTEKRAPSGSDIYESNRYERPFTAPDMTYLPDVDLTRVEMSISAPWVYFTFSIADARAEGIGQTLYGIEFDLNRDGRGDILAWGASPAGTDWTTDGVQVWRDTNDDVGGPRPQVSDAPWLSGNGYDQNVFDAGQGADADLAWIRQADGGTKIELAIKYSALNDATQFLWNGLADLGVRRPDWFDYNDHFTQTDAGSPLPVQTDLYPLAQLFAVDNTCRDAFGFIPAGTEPGLCEYFGALSGVVWQDYDQSGTINSGEPGLSGETVTLGQGACPSSGYQTATTSSSGAYSFPSLLIGTYCVGVTLTGTQTATTPNPVTVVITEGATKHVNFGIYTPPVLQ